MKLKDIFLGKPLYWLLIIIIAAAMWWMGSDSQHVRDFVPFSLKLLGLTVICVGVIILTYKPGDRETREPFEKDEI
jgi:hypothetical protein